MGLWLHALLCFLAALHGLHSVLSLLTAHPLHFACLFGLLQALVLVVRLREPTEDEKTTDLENEEQGKKAKEPRKDPKGCCDNVRVGSKGVAFRRKVEKPRSYAQ